MASTSTGYDRNGIFMEQYSTAGQVLRWSSGSKAYFSNDAEIELESGATMNVEGGAVLKFATSAVMRVPVSSGTTNTTDQKLPAFGVSILTAATSNPATTAKGGPLWTLNQPKGSGYMKKIVLMDTSKTVAVRLSTDKSVLGDAGAKYHSILLIGKAAASTALNSVDLISRSSVKWILAAKSSGMLSATWSSWYRS